MQEILTFDKRDLQKLSLLQLLQPKFGHQRGSRDTAKTFFNQIYLNASNKQSGRIRIHDGKLSCVYLKFFDLKMFKNVDTHFASGSRLEELKV